MLTTIFATLILLAIVIVLHEFGHFIVAKLLGIRVERFSIGFPPRLFGFKKGDTDYCVSAIPLGGYIKVTGQDPTEELTGAKYEFSARRPWERILVILAGPIMNIGTAFIFVIMALMIGIPTLSPIIDVVVPDSIAYHSGIRDGDILVSVNNSPVNSIEKYTEYLNKNLGEKVIIGLNRGEKQIETEMAIPEKLEEIIDLGIEFHIPAMIGLIQPNKPADRAGLKTGDEIISINGIPTNNRWSETTKIIRSGEGEALELIIRRNGELLTFSVVPEYSEMEEDYLIGITPQLYTGGMVQYNFSEAIYRGLFVYLGQIGMIIDGFRRIVFGEIPIREALGGPQSIANIAGQYFNFGAGYYLLFMAMISITLGVINLFPIPVLDGGHILFHIIEWTRNKPLSAKTWEVATKFGFALLLTLMIFVIINDFIGSGVFDRLIGVIQ